MISIEDNGTPVLDYYYAHEHISVILQSTARAYINYAQENGALVHSCESIYQLISTSENGGLVLVRNMHMRASEIQNIQNSTICSTTYQNIQTFRDPDIQNNQNRRNRANPYPY